MKLSGLKLSLICLFLWESQVFAQTQGAAIQGAEPTSIGALPEDVPMPEDAADIVLDPAAPPEEAVEPLKTFRAIHSNGHRQAQGEVGQLFDQASLSYSERQPLSIDERRLNWDLGLSSDYSGVLGTQLQEERSWGSHRLSLELAWNGRGFKGDGAGLEEIYQAANRLAQDFTLYESPATTRSDGALRLADTMRVGRQSQFALSGEFRQDHYQIEDALEDGSLFESGSLRWLLGLGRDRRLETSLRRSVVLYRDRRNQFEQSQALNEAETQLIQPLSAHYLGGVGFRSIDGERNGPLLSLSRKADERGSGQLKLSYLKDHDNSQFLGSLKSQYLWTRQLTMTVNLEQSIDLLASYGSLITTNQTRDREQKLSRAYEMTWAYAQRFSSYSLLLASNRQDYANAQFIQQELRLQIDHRLNALDQLIASVAYRGVNERGQVTRPIDRRYGSLAGDWRHYWGLDTRLFGARSFGQIGLSYERLWEGEKELERKTLSLALGQEWL